MEKECFLAAGAKGSGAARKKVEGKAFFLPFGNTIDKLSTAAQEPPVVEYFGE